MNTTTLEELKKAFIADHDKSIAKIKQDIAQERKTERTKAIQKELAQSVSGLDAVQQMQGIMAKLSAFSGYQDNEAEERRKNFSVHICQKIVLASERRAELYTIKGQNKKGRERMAKNNRRSFSIRFNRRSALEIEVINDMVELGIL